ncbi:MAG: iron chaperone [Acidimicrobiales bacterium]
MTTKVETVDDYLASFPAETRPVLQQLRATLCRAAPEAEESIRDGMPTLRLRGQYLICYAGWTRHIGLYPIPALDEPLASEVAPYRAAKDTMRLPLGEPIPYELVERLVLDLAGRIRGEDH